MQDAVVLELISFRFQKDRRLNKINIAIETIHGKKGIVLRGVVPTYTLKQIAQAILIGNFDGYEIHNLTEVSAQKYFHDFTENS